MQAIVFGGPKDGKVVEGVRFTDLTYLFQKDLYRVLYLQYPDRSYRAILIHDSINTAWWDGQSEGPE